LASVSVLTSSSGKGRPSVRCSRARTSTTCARGGQV